MFLWWLFHLRPYCPIDQSANFILLVGSYFSMQCGLAILGIVGWKFVDWLFGWAPLDRFRRKSKAPYPLDQYFWNLGIFSPSTYFNFLFPVLKTCFILKVQLPYNFLNVAISCGIEFPQPSKTMSYDCTDVSKNIKPTPQSFWNCGAGYLSARATNWWRVPIERALKHFVAAIFKEIWVWFNPVQARLLTWL